MKILMVNKFLYPNGGSETYMLKLGEYLASIGHEVQYFGMDDERNIVGNRCNVNAPNVDFHGSDSGIRSKISSAVSTVYSKAAREAIGKVLKDFRPDIVHMNNINFQLTPAVIYEIHSAGIPIVQTVHDVQIACPCHRFYIEHKQAVCEQCRSGSYWKCIKNKCLQGSAAKSAVAAVESYYYHMRNTYNLVDLYICPSRFMADKIEMAGVSHQRIKVMYNFTDKLDKNYGGKSDKKYALYFGRFSQEKGIRTLIENCKKMSDIYTIFAGSGPLEEEVKRAAEEFENIEFAGFKSGDELKKLIAGAAFSIYPSEWYENCPLSVIESQALGTPVIGSDLGGTKELIDDGRTGLIFMGGDSQSLSLAMRKLWNNDELISRMSKNCAAVKGNNIEDYTKKLTDRYKLLIEQYSGGKNNAE